MKHMCANCKYFDTSKDHDNEQEYWACKRHAPMIIHGSGYGWSNQRFPKMDGEDWCGEWEASPSDGLNGE